MRAQIDSRPRFGHVRLDECVGWPILLGFMQKGRGDIHANVRYLFWKVAGEDPLTTANIEEPIISVQIEQTERIGYNDLSVVEMTFLADDGIVPMTRGGP